MHDDINAGVGCSYASHFNWFVLSDGERICQLDMFIDRVSDECTDTPFNAIATTQSYKGGIAAFNQTVAVSSRLYVRIPGNQSINMRSHSLNASVSFYMTFF